MRHSIDITVSLTQPILRAQNELRECGVLIHLRAGRNASETQAERRKDALVTSIRIGVTITLTDAGTVSVTQAGYNVSTDDIESGHATMSGRQIEAERVKRIASAFVNTDQPTSTAAAAESERGAAAAAPHDQAEPLRRLMSQAEVTATIRVTHVIEEVTKQLVTRGLTEDEAQSLLAEFPPEHVRGRLNWYDRFRATNRVAAPFACLRSACRKFSTKA